MNLFEFLKDFFPLNCLLKIKYHSSLIKQEEISLNTKSNRIFYLDAPDYANIGDQAIALSIKNFAYKYFPEYEFVEILQKDILKYVESLKKQMNPQDIIFLTGGGNMGNVYKIFEATRRFLINSFPHNKIVVFPQTMDYTNNFWGMCSRKYSEKIYSAHKKLILCARENFSYKQMKELYPNTNVVLCPDIVLSLDKCYQNNSSNIVHLCLRNDCETLLSDKERKYIEYLLKKENLEFKYISTLSDIDTITKDNRELIVNNKLKDFSLSKFVITDRLHAMIFCFLTNTPCIVFGNSNHKIKGVYDLIEDVPYIQYLENTENLLNVVQQFKNLSFYADKTLDFSKLAAVIRED